MKIPFYNKTRRYYLTQVYIKPIKIFVIHQKIHIVKIKLYKASTFFDDND